MDLLWIHRAARCDCVVSWHDESALLEEHLWSDSERWTETLEVNETKSSLDEDLIVGLASILDCIFEHCLVFSCLTEWDESCQCLLGKGASQIDELGDGLSEGDLSAGWEWLLWWSASVLEVLCECELLVEVK